MRSDRFGSLDPKVLDPIHDYSGFDRVGLSDRHYQQSLKATYDLLGRPSPLEAHGVPLGSIRFCPEWMAVRQNRVRPYAHRGRDGARKLVFLLSQPAANSHWRAVEACLTLLGKQQNYDVVVKPHTRRFKKALNTLAPNITIDTQSDSSSLIDWADIVLFWGTSMAIEGYMKRKIMLCADFCNANRIVFTLYNAGWILRCLDDLHAALAACETDSPEPHYAQSDIDAMLHNVVNDAQEGLVSDRYLAFLREQEALSVKG